LRRTREEAEQTRQELLTTAMFCYAEHGINNVSLKAIAAEAGVTHGAFYWHFKNRDDLLIALAQVVDLPFEQHLLEQLQAIEQNALEALRDFMVQVTLDVMNDRHSKAVYNLFYSRQQMLPDVEDLNEILDQNVQEWLAYIDRFLKQARKQKQVKKKTRNQPLAQMFLAQMFGVLALDMRLTPEEMDQKALVETAFDALVQGIAAD
jgi:AcrR family transcriptional regulator